MRGAPDVVLVGDGAGIRKAALRPIVGADRTARFLLGPLGKTQESVDVEPASVNGTPALLVHVGGELDGVSRVRAEGGRIARLYYLRNPEKLRRIGIETALALG